MVDVGGNGERSMKEHIPDYALDDYQLEVLETWNDELPERDRRAHAALGLSDEAGEVAGLIKKELFNGHPPDRTKVVKELGDVFYYFAALAWEYGITLDEVAYVNIKKLRERYPNGYSHEDSILRRDVHGNE